MILEWKKSYIELIAVYIQPKNSNHLRSHLEPGKRILGKQIRPNFLRSTSLLNKILPTNLGACKPTFHTFYTSHLRWNSNMRRCFYHTDLRQNAVFHNFLRKIALIQYSEPSKHAWALSNRFSLLTSAKFSVNIKRIALQHNKEFIVFIVYLMVL